LDRKNLNIFIALIILTATAGLVYVFILQKPAKEEPDEFIREENWGEKYECSITIQKRDSRGNEFGYFTYVKEGAKHRGYYASHMRDALAWIRSNTSERSLFFNWWDYGHMIVGFAERESVIKNPSVVALESVANPERIEEFDPHEKLVDVTTALTTTDSNEVISIMNIYRAEYILLTVDDGGIMAFWIFRYAGLDLSNYVKTDESMEHVFNPNQYNELGTETVMYKILNFESIEGFTQVYRDDSVIIYKLST